MERIDLERGQVWRHKPSGQLSTVMRMDTWWGVSAQVVHKRRYRTKWTEVKKFLRDYEYTGEKDEAFGTGPISDPPSA